MIGVEIHRLYMFSFFRRIYIFLFCNNNHNYNSNEYIFLLDNFFLGFVLYEQPKDGKLEISLKGRLLPPYYGYLTKEKINVWVQLMVMKEVPTDKSEIKESDVIFLQVRISLLFLYNQLYLVITKCS